MKCVSEEHLAQLVQSNTWNFFISLKDIPETKSFFYVKHNKLPKLLKLFTAHTNKPSYIGDFQITFNYDLLVPTLLYIFQHGNSHLTLSSTLNQLSHTLKCNHTELLTDTLTILDTLQTFNILENHSNISIINKSNLLTLSLITSSKHPPITSTETFLADYNRSEKSSTATTIQSPISSPFLPLLQGQHSIPATDISISTTTTATVHIEQSSITNMAANPTCSNPRKIQ